MRRLALFYHRRARILESTGNRRAAENAYASAFRPDWPLALSADYLELLRRHGRYRIDRRILTLQLARRQVEAARFADAEATLRALYEADRSDMEVFGDLARTLGAAGKLAELTGLYRSAIEELRVEKPRMNANKRESGEGNIGVHWRSLAVNDAHGSGLRQGEIRSRTAELRAGMIRTLDHLGRYEEAVDQYIEIVNAFPEDLERLTAALNYAERHNLTQRITRYYERLSQESFKNYRWQLVLGRIYERNGPLEGAAEQYRAALINEPQRNDLRRMLASALSHPGNRAPRYAEAIAVLREGWLLSSNDPGWLIEIARIQRRQGQEDAAIQTIRQALASQKIASAQAQMKIAAQLSAWGSNHEAVLIYERAFARLVENLKNEPVRSEDVAGYVRALVRAVPAAEMLAAEQAKDPYKGEFNYEGEIAKLYRIAGDTGRELEWLHRAYASASGAVALAQGDLKAALKAWNAMIRRRGALRPSIADAQAYLKVVADHGFLQEALPQIEELIVAYMRRVPQSIQRSWMRSWGQSALPPVNTWSWRYYVSYARGVQLEAIQPLLREIAARAGADSKITKEVAATFAHIIERLPDDLPLGRSIIWEELLPEASLGDIYRMIHRRMSNSAAATWKRSEYSSSYWTGSAEFSSSDLRGWRRHFVDYLIRHGLLDEARLVVEGAKGEQAGSRHWQPNRIPMNRTIQMARMSMIRMRGCRCLPALARIHFNRYWIHNNRSELAKIERGLIDLQAVPEGWIERRWFALLTQSLSLTG